MSTPGNRRSRDGLVSSSSADSGKCPRNSLYHQRRSSARKSLQFGTSPEKKTNISSAEGNQVASSSADETDHRVPPVHFDFWSSPPPPKPIEEEVGIIVKRRSLRLRIPQVLDSTSPIQPRSSGLDAALQNETVEVPYDRGSVFSDYGTSSESSSCIRPSSHHPSSSSNSYTASRDKFLHPCRSDVSSTQSVGYASDLDLDDCLSNLSIDDANKSTQDSRQWDSDLEREDGKGSEWEDGPKLTGIHLNLTELKLKSLRTFMKTYQGINVLVPLDGYEIHHPQKCVSRNSINNQYRSIRYDLRNRPSRQLEALLTIQVYNDINIELDLLRQGIRIFQVSPVISLQPHDVKFCYLYPAIVQIPLKTHPSTGDEIHCLYSTKLVGNIEDSHQNIQWKSVEIGRNCVRDGRAVFETNVFGLFVLIIRPKPLSDNKIIRARVGGKLLVHDLPSVEINFPKEATMDDTIKASTNIFLDTEESVAEFLSKRELKLKSTLACPTPTLINGNEAHCCLATPIVQLDPHGIRFDNDPVTITLPVPDYDKIVSRLESTAKLSIWQSNTAYNEPSSWEKLEVDYKITHTKINGEPVTQVNFPVRHFSFFKGVWNVIADYLYEAKIGMMYYFVSFPMKCHANMDEFVSSVVTNENGSKEKASDDGESTESEHKDLVINERRFGLEINVFQAEKQWPPNNLYKHEVGRSNEKLVKPGRITVKLKTQCFEADALAGEEELEKEEPDFRGREFSLQFACKFKSNVNIERGPFGKVLVTRHLSPRQKQPIFEFNLQKHGNEADIQPPKSPKESCSNEWSHVALFEFAQNLFIIDGDNWKLFAKEVGMTQQEIRNISWKDAGKASDPFKMVVEHYKGRGGTPEEFVDAMYKCHRSLKVNGSFSPESKKSKSSTGSSGRGSLSSNNVNFDAYGSHDSDTSGTQSRDSGLPHGRKRSHPSTSNNTTTPKASGSGIVSGSMRSSHKPSKRPRFAKPKSAPSQLSFISDADADADLSESDTSDDNAHMPGPSSCLSLDESRLCRNDKTKLENMFLWDISFYLNISNWRALGRSLGLDETVLIDVDNGFKSTSFRECSYQMLLQWRQKFPSKCTYGTLYCALMKEGMNDVAKQMATITRNNAS